MCLARIARPANCHRQQPASRRRKEERKIAKAVVIGQTQGISIASRAGQVVQDLLASRFALLAVFPQGGIAFRYHHGAIEMLAWQRSIRRPVDVYRSLNADVLIHAAKELAPPNE